MTRNLAAICAGLVPVLLLACGGGGPASPTPVTTTTLPACTQTLVFQGGGSIPSKTLGRQPFSTTTFGRLDVILDWTFAASTIGVYVVAGDSCTLAQFNARTCTFLIRSEPGGPKPRKVSALNVSPGAYDMFIGNYSSEGESLSTQVFVSTASCPALSGAETGREAGHAAADTALTAVLRW